MNQITLKKVALTWLPEALAVVLAMIALRKGCPSGYYSRSHGLLLAISAGMLAVLFNPILRVMLDRGKWEILNIALIAIAIWSAAVSLKSTGDQNR